MEKILRFKKRKKNDKKEGANVQKTENVEELSQEDYLKAAEVLCYVNLKTIGELSKEEIEGKIKNLKQEYSPEIIRQALKVVNYVKELGNWFYNIKDRTVGEVVNMINDKPGVWNDKFINTLKDFFEKNKIDIFKLNEQDKVLFFDEFLKKIAQK